MISTQQNYPIITVGAPKQLNPEVLEMIKNFRKEQNMKDLKVGEQ
jgi:hypothetical protein